MSMIISPDVIKSFKMGQFLDAPDSAKTSIKNGEEVKTWREVFVVRDVRAGETDDGEFVSFDLTVPSDVISTNQGRTAQLYLGFPEDQTSTRFRIAGQQLFELFKVVGYSPVIDGGFKLSAIDKDALRNMRFNAQVKLGPDKDGVIRQNLGYFRTPK